MDIKEKLFKKYIMTAIFMQRSKYDNKNICDGAEIFYNKKTEENQKKTK